MASNLPLPQFYAQILQPLVTIFDDTVSASDPASQLTLAVALDDLHLTARMLTSLGVFSTNESMDELGDSEMVFMTLGWVVAECEGKGGLTGPEDRISSLKRSQVCPFTDSDVEEVF